MYRSLKDVIAGISNIVECGVLFGDCLPAVGDAFSGPTRSRANIGLKREKRYVEKSLQHPKRN